MRFAWLYSCATANYVDCDGNAHPQFEQASDLPSSTVVITETAKESAYMGRTYASVILQPHRDSISVLAQHALAVRPH